MPVSDFKKTKRPVLAPPTATLQPSGRSNLRAESASRELGGSLSRAWPWKPPTQRGGVCQVDHHCDAGRWSSTEGSGVFRSFNATRGRSARAVGWSLSFPGQVRLTSRRNVGSHGRSPPHEDQKSVFIFNSSNRPNLCYTVRFCLVFFFTWMKSTHAVCSRMLCVCEGQVIERVTTLRPLVVTLGDGVKPQASFFLFKSSLVTVIHFF